MQTRYAWARTKLGNKHQDERRKLYLQIDEELVQSEEIFRSAAQRKAKAFRVALTLLVQNHYEEYCDYVCEAASLGYSCYTGQPIKVRSKK